MHVYKDLLKSVLLVKPVHIQGEEEEEILSSIM